jgi:hypothetical protein
VGQLAAALADHVVSEGDRERRLRLVETGQVVRSTRERVVDTSRARRDRLFFAAGGLLLTALNIVVQVIWG